jgi:hypothetical protein
MSASPNQQRDATLEVVYHALRQLLDAVRAGDAREPTPSRSRTLSPVPSDLVIHHEAGVPAARNYT